MIQFNKVSKSYGGNILLDAVSFKINKGEKCALLGRNGSGKTTVLRMIAGEETSDGGDISWPKNYRIGYLQQHLVLAAPTVLEEASKGLPHDKKEEQYRVEKILFGLGFQKGDLLRSPSEFSGGYQIRIHLCKLLVSEPDCLLLDEPTNYLDVVSLRWLSRFLRGWKGEFLIISHDREFLDNVSTHMIGIHRHQVRKVEGGTENFYTQILQEEEIYERTRQNMEKKRSHMEFFVKRFGAKATKAGQAQSRLKAIARMPILEKLTHLHHLDFQFAQAPFTGQKVLEARELSFSYSAANPLIQNFNLLLENGQRIAVVGKNGRGKSTLLQLLIQQLKPLEGNVRVWDNVKIGYFGQTHIDRLDPSKTVEEEIQSANTLLNITDVRGICGAMMFSDDRALKRISVLSGGERSRVLLGKILAAPCNLLILDEPSHHLDMESLEALVLALEKFEGAILIVTHSELILRRIPEKLIICQDNAQKFFDGTYEEFLEKGGWEDERSEKKPKDAGKKVDLMRERTQKLQPLRKKIETIENNITTLEIKIEKDTQHLIEASERAESNAIAKLSIELDKTREALEKLYEELDKISAEYEAIKAE